MSKCAICKTEVSRGSNRCENCGAERGYVLAGNPRLPYGPVRTILLGVLIPGAIAFWAFQSWDNGLFWRGLTILFALPVVFCLYRLLIRGPIWYRKEQIGDR